MSDTRGVAWSDGLYARMFEQRVVLLSGDLDDQNAARLATELMTLDATGDDAVQMLVNSPGGTLDAAFTLIDVIDLLGVPVHATCIGRVEGSALGVLAVATRRYAVRHARFRATLPRDTYVGNADELAAWSAQRDADVQRFAARLSEDVRMSEPAVVEAFQTGRYFDAQEAIRLGFIDEIAKATVAPVRRIDERPIGFRSQRLRG
jgi:ATP-dependent Clp protease protease subunit